VSTQPTFTPQWKEEVNRRLAAHKSRRAQSPAQETAQQQNLGDSRAAEAAARVAARYAKAPSYSQMQAEEARVAVRHAEIATKVALEAQAVAQTALFELNAATQEQAPRGPAVVQTIPAPVRHPEIEPVANPAPAPVPVAEKVGPALEAPVHAPEKDSAVPVAASQPEAPSAPRVYGIRWDPDLPVRRVEPKPPTRRAQEEFQLSAEDWWSKAEVSEDLRNNPIEVGEDGPAHANLIQFPREVVATRKMRPRLAEAAAGAATGSEGQLSIFEVDPATVSTEAAAPPVEQVAPASIWNRAGWTGMQLDTNPVDVLASAREVDPALAALPVASVGFRLMAAVVDCALILASFITAGFLVAHNFQHLPAGKPAEFLGIAALALIGILYYALFFAFPISTPGMMYAGIGLCTFDDQSPTREQLRRRLRAMLLSVLPVGLGLVWSIFDEDHLSWHDRHSRTYLRRL